MRRNLLGAACAAALSLLSLHANAARPYVVLHDDGTIEKHAFATFNDELAIQKKLLSLYKATGEEMPEVMSVWTTFPLGGNSVATYFDPIGNDVKGIGLEKYYPPDGTMKSTTPPLRSILFHNNLLALPMRAQIQGAPLDGFARYLFLLELSHNWGPAISLPAPNGSELIGFDFHWSFWMDAGGSPAGGNGWKDNGDGTFTAIAADPKTIAYSMIDLYLLGLATKDEVQPFGILENVTPPANITDPLWGGSYDAHSFPWFDAKTTFTAKATRRQVTIDDVITANGARDPAAGKSQTTWKLGIVLLVSSKDSTKTIDDAMTTFDPIAGSFAPAFHEATHMRGSMDVVTHDPSMGTGGAGGAGGAASSTSASGAGGAGGSPVTSTSSSGSTSSGSAATPASSSGCSCETSGARDSRAWSGAIACALVLAAARRRRRAPR